MLFRSLTLAAGGRGMVYGQDFDMYWTGRADFNSQILEKIHRNKTGALIGAACSMGALCGGANDEQARVWREFGVLVGVAFQAVDDALDGARTIGKTPNKDKGQKKLTYLTLFEPEEVAALAREKTKAALALIPGNVRADGISEFVESLLSRPK